MNQPKIATADAYDDFTRSVCHKNRKRCAHDRDGHCIVLATIMVNHTAEELYTDTQGKTKCRAYQTYAEHDREVAERNGQQDRLF